MASRGVFSMLGRKAAAAGAAGASVAANQPSAHAREAVVHAAAAPAAPSTARGQVVYDDDWTEPHFEGQEVLVFRSFRADEVDEAFASVQSALEQQQHRGKGANKAKSVLAVRAPLTVEEDADTAPAGSSAAHAAGALATTTGPPSPATEMSDGSSYGEAATDVLGEPLVAAAGAHADNPLASVAHTSAAAADASHTAMNDLLQISRKLLTRPGLQREVFKCMVEDAEVRELMLRQSRNINLYLQAVGVHTPAGLITDKQEGQEGDAAGLRYRLPASVRARVRDGTNNEGAEPAGEDHEGEGKDLLGKILDAVASCIDNTGSWLAGLGGWLRGRFLELGMLLGGAFGMVGANHDEGTDDGEEGGEKSGREGRRRGRSAGDVVLGAAMVVTVAVFCVLLARNPRLVVAASTAAAGTAAAAKRQQAAGLGGGAGGAPRS